MQALRLRDAGYPSLASAAEGLLKQMRKTGTTNRDQKESSNHDKKKPAVHRL